MADYSAIPDAALVALLKKSDRQAFTEIYNRFKGALYVYACKIVKEEDLAEDLVQEIFISLWDKRETVVFKTTVSAYLFTAVRYKFFDWVDKQKVRDDYAASLQVFIDQGEWATDNLIAERELLNFVDQQIELLPEKMRAVFLLSYKDNLSFKEIGLRLKISDKTAQNQANTALKILRGKLGTFTVLLYIFH